MSGGRATIQNRKGNVNTTQLGDITCVHPDGSWITNNAVLECKHYRDLNINGFLLGNTGKLWKFWKKLRKEAKKHKRAPILIAKQNLVPTMLITNIRGITLLNTWGANGTPRLIIKRKDVPDVFVCFFDTVFKL